MEAVEKTAPPAPHTPYPIDPGAKPPAEEEASFYYSSHDLREMFSRENAERRRQGGKTMRRLLTAEQDKKVLNKMVRLREEYEVANNDDVILVWVKQELEAGKGEDIHPDLVAAARTADIPKRRTPVEPEV